MFHHKSLFSDNDQLIVLYAVLHCNLQIKYVKWQEKTIVGHQLWLLSLSLYYFSM